MKMNALAHFSLLSALFSSLSAAQTARDAYHAIETKTTRLQKKLDDLKKLLDRDYGTDQQFMTMDGKCFELTVKQYVYEVCPYASAKQKEGHSSTSLGSWQGLEVTPSGQSMMKFTGGQSCWQGPQRSLTVKLACGAEDKLLTVEEPSKCVYEIAMQTPTVCNQQHAETLKQTLESGGHQHDEL